MGWRWLVNGLGGLVGLMLSTLPEQPETEAEHHQKLGELIEKLTEIRNRLKVKGN